MPFAEDRASLLAILAQLSFRLGDFTLASGAKSDYYIDCRTTTLDAEGGRLSGILMAAMLRDVAPQAQAVGGLTMGADPLVSNIATASAYFRQQHPDSPLVHGFLVRKALKAHGTGRQIEGYVRPRCTGRRRRRCLHHRWLHHHCDRGRTRRRHARRRRALPGRPPTGWPRKHRSRNGCRTLCRVVHRRRCARGEAAPARITLALTPLQSPSLPLLLS